MANAAMGQYVTEGFIPREFTERLRLVAENIEEHVRELGLQPVRGQFTRRAKDLHREGNSHSL
jgi:hypothetical protein